MNNTLSKNLKRLRTLKNMTQEQAAEYLGVSTQSVSRWECGNTLPDVLMLPKIAKLYCVTIDELYKETSAAYENYAQRMAAVYESTGEPEDFIRADIEFKKLKKDGSLTAEDLRLYGILHHQMMKYCITKAEELFDMAIENGADESVVFKTKQQKILLYSQIGKGEESIENALKAVKNGSDNAADYLCIISAYFFNGKNESAYEWCLKAISKFPDKAEFYVYCGDVCKNLKRYDEAFSCWDKALLIDESFYDAKFSKGFCYEELREYEKAYEIWREIADELKGKGYAAEAEYPMLLAEKAKLYKQ